MGERGVLSTSALKTPLSKPIYTICIELNSFVSKVGKISWKDKMKYTEIPALSQRLAAVAEMVREGSVVADIGTDHAYLPVYLVRSGRCPHALACDLRPGPLDHARKTVDSFDVGDMVELRQTDGLDGVNYADDVVIAGMGGELIVRILGRSAFIRDSRVALVLQPMTALPELRAFLCLSGFEIKKETVVREGDKLYLVIRAGYTGVVFTPDDFFCQTGRLPGAGGTSAEYLMCVAARFQKKAEGLRKSRDHADEAAKAEEMASRIAASAEDGYFGKPV